MKKSIITSCPFPLIELTVNIKYAEIEKPSGVGYIILVLIKNAKNYEETFYDVLLKQFGVPEDIQSIFADEIELLLNREILRTKQGILYKGGQRPDLMIIDEDKPRPIFFDEAKLGHFEFTENGERMFREGFLPTGEEKSRQITVYFDPLISAFLFTAPSKKIPMTDSNCYTTDFMEKVDPDLSGIKDYLIENIKQTGLQKEERFLDCSIVRQEYLITAADKNLELLIDNDGMEVSFKTTGAEAFYKNYFTPEMLEQELASKSMFEFRSTVDSIEGFSEFKNLSAVYTPEEYKKQIDRPVKLLITREGENIFVKRVNTKTEFKRNELIDSVINAIFPCWSFITIDAKEIRFYTAARVNLTERVISKSVNINLLVEQTFDAEQEQNVAKAIFSECKMAEFKPEYCGLIRAISELEENEDYIRHYIESKLKNENDRAEQVEILLEANKVFIGLKWVSIAKDFANKIYNELISELTKENAGYYVKIARTLDEIRKPGKDDLFNAVSNKLSKQITNQIELFNVLLKAGFNENESLSVANIINIYVNKALAGISELEESPISDKFSSLAHNLLNLKENLGIQNTVKYAFRHDYNINEFIDNYKAYNSKLSDIKKYEGFAQDGFKEFFKYTEIMKPVFDSIMTERNASQSPEKISIDYIHKKIDGGDYRTAVGDMFIRLDYILGTLLKIEKNILISADKKIESAVEEKFLTKENATILHELRIFRNKLHHPTEEKLEFNKEKINKWADAVFAVTEKAEEKK
jgi:hypothetical protein